MFKQISKISLFAFIGAVYFAISTIIIHFYRNDLNFFSNSLSCYAVGHMGIVLEIGIFLIGLTEILISINLFKIGLKLSPIFLFIAGIGIMLVTIFPTAVDYSYNLQYIFHVFGAGIHFVFFPTAIFYLAKKISKNNFKFFSIITGFTTSVLCLILIFFFINKVVLNLGFFEKMDIFCNTSWLLLISYKMIRPLEFQKLLN